MIVRILSGGKSFKGLAAYLTHDPEAKTTERVAWTHTLNCADDHVPSAVDEMLWTARNAELLKQEAGVRAGGRATENPVKHLSLNWAPDENPTREHMIETAEGFLRHMNWHEHQAVLVAHDDKAHAHVHVMLNMVHPETGLRLDDNFERRRAQAWALEYEREHGRIYCEQRLKDVAEREEAPTRPAWMAFRENQEKFEREEKTLELQAPILADELNDNSPENNKSHEWKNLKEIQRAERVDFFAEGKSEFSELRKSIYREVREEFRDRWGDYYEAKRNGADETALVEIKAKLVAEQKTALEERRDEACRELRETRDDRYRELLDGQRETRLALHARQEAGFDNALFLERVGYRDGGKDIAEEFREAAESTTQPRQPGRTWDADDGAFTRSPKEENGRMRSGVNVGADIGEGLGFGAISFLESLADGFVGAKPDRRRREPEPEPSGPNPFETAAEDARKQQSQRERQDAEDEWRKRQRSPGE
jgi:hypothetical protein